VETDLAIHYPAAGYIFTNKKNKKLYDRLERGFRMAVDDGSFDTLFYNHPDMKTVLEKANLKNRRIFELKNPLLPEETPLNDKRLWYKP
jgi:GR25 family glycosyltransferase involved in LPS biosynthesis